MRKLWYLAVAVGAALLSLMLASPSSATAMLDDNVLTYDSTEGAAVAVGDVISAGLAAGTTGRFMSTAGGSTGVTCTTSAFSGTVATNPAAGGVATASLTTQSFSGCTENILGVVSVQSITVDNLAYNVSVDGAAATLTLTGGTAGLIQATVRLNTILGSITCVYQATSLTGATSNTDNSIQFTNQPFAKTSGPSLCFANAYFTARYAPVTGNAGALVFVH